MGAEYPANKIPIWMEMIMKGNYIDFVINLGRRESGNRYDSLNRWGYMGRWQFGKQRLYDLGFSVDGWHPKFMSAKKVITQRQFLSSPDFQDFIMKKHVMQLKFYIEKNFSNYLGKTINGIPITTSGLIAGAHLLGIGGVKKFLKGKDGQDGLGTKISEYIDRFGDYELNFQYIKEADIPPIRLFDQIKKTPR